MASRDVHGYPTPTSIPATEVRCEPAASNNYGSKPVRGTEVAALFYSLIKSAKLCRVQPKAYLEAAETAAICGEAALLPHDFKKGPA